MKEVRLVIFDFDGVIMDTEWAHEEVKREMCRERRIQCPSSLSFSVGHSVRESWEEILGETASEQKVEELARCQFCRTYLRLRETKQQVTAGLLELLPHLRNAGYLLAVCSGSDEDFVKKILKDWGLEAYFDLVRGGDGIARLKPAPDIYLDVLKQMKIPAKEAVAVEDSLSGSLAARRAGIRCIRFTNEGRCRQPVDEGEETVNIMTELPVLLETSRI